MSWTYQLGRPILDHMERRQLGSDGFITSALGLGCMGLSQGYGPADDDQSVRAIHRAIELGVFVAIGIGDARCGAVSSFGPCVAKRRVASVVVKPSGVVCKRAQVSSADKACHAGASSADV